MRPVPLFATISLLLGSTVSTGVFASERQQLALARERANTIPKSMSYKRKAFVPMPVDKPIRLHEITYDYEGSSRIPASQARRKKFRAVPIPVKRPDSIGRGMPNVSPEQNHEVQMQLFEFVEEEDNIEDEFYVLEVQLDDFILSDGSIAYRNNESVMMPLSEVVAMFQFPIEVDPERGYAEGWFIAEHRTFLLDMTKALVEIEGARANYSQEMITLYEDDIYVDIILLSEWFPLDFELDMKDSQLLVNSRELLPMELAAERRKFKGRYGGFESPDYPRHEMPYRWISWPYADINMTTEYDSRDDDNPFATRVDTLATADTLQLNSRLFVSANEREGFSDIRFTTGRKDPDGELLGSMHATEFALGDISTNQLPLIADNLQGRGIKLSNFPLERVSGFNQVTIRGDALTDWEVELYRNDVLLDFQTIGDNGQYEFIDVPLITGMNIIRLELYGPFGERRTATERYLVSPDLIESDKTYYNISFNQHERDLFQINEPFVREETEGDPRFVAEFEHGIAKQTSLFGHVASIPLEDNKQHTYVTGGVSTSLAGVFTRVGVSGDVEHGGTAIEAGLQTRYEDINFDLEYEEYFDFLSERTESVNDPLTRRIKLTSDGRFKTPVFSSLNIALSGEYEEFDSRRKQYEYANRISLYFTKANISNTLTYRITDNVAADDTEVLDGDAFLSLRLGDLTLRGGGMYNLDPNTELNNLTLTADYDIEDDLGLRFGVVHELTGEQLTSYSFGVNQQFEHFQLAANSTYDDDGEFLVGLSLSLGLGQDPKSGGVEFFSDNVAESGLVSSRVFIDKDNDGEFSDGDEPVEGIELRADGGVVGDQTREDGTIMVSDLTAYRPVALEIDNATIEDPYLISLTEGVEIVPRPGVPVEVDFALVVTGEIDGTVYLTRNGEKREASNVQLELINEHGEVIKVVRTAYDGFYLFELVPPGLYKIRISPDQIRRLGIIPPKPVGIAIDGEDSIITGVDFTLDKGLSEAERREELEALLAEEEA